jgi:hypothetical protein
MQKLTDISDAYWAIALMMKAVHTSETSVNLYRSTRHNIPEEATFILATVRI